MNSIPRILIINICKNPEQSRRSIGNYSSKAKISHKKILEIEANIEDD